MPSPELQSPASWMWKPTSLPGRRPDTVPLTFTRLPCCLKLIVPRTSLPFVGSSTAVACGPDIVRSYHMPFIVSQPASRKSVAATASPRITWRAWTAPWKRPCSFCSSRRPCPGPCRGQPRPLLWLRRPCPPRPASPHRSSPARPGAWRRTPRRLRSGRRQAARRWLFSWLLLHVRCSGGNRPSGAFAPAGLDLFVPEPVVLLRPRFVGVALAHVLVGMLDADRAHVDVSQRSGDIEQRRRRVPDPGVLHQGARLVEVREQQHEAAPGDDHAQADHTAPEPRLLAAVETARRHFLAAGKEGPGLGEPLQVVQARKVVADVDDDHCEHGNDEEGRDEVVQVLPQCREPREQRVADDRQQDVLAEQHEQAGEAKHAEADRDRPVDDALDGIEAKDLAAAERLPQLDRTFGEIQRADRQQHEEYQPPAVERDGAI